jgi:RHH-type rel operon transcriptional repressor/antitoxin RelB
MSAVLPIRLSEDLNARLDFLAKETGRTKTYYARQAIVTYLEDIEDTYLALQRLEKPANYLTTDELEKKLGLED